MRFGATFTLMLLAMSAQGGEVFKWKAPDGSTVYSDRPQQGAEEVHVAPLQTYHSPPLPPEGAGRQDKPETFPGYDRFEITRPQNNATLRDNGGNVSIALRLDPGLQNDHTLEVFLDGKLLGGSGKATSVQLRNVDRGTHTVHAIIKGASGKEFARTAPVTFHLHRTFVRR